MHRTYLLLGARFPPVSAPFRGRFDITRRGRVDVEVERPAQGKLRIVAEGLKVASLEGVVDASGGQVFKTRPKLLPVDTLVEFPCPHCAVPPPKRSRPLRCLRRK